MTLHTVHFSKDGNHRVPALLSALDGPINTKSLKALARRKANLPEYVPSILDLAAAREADLQFAGIWLLRDHLEAAGRIAGADAKRLAACLADLRRWDSVLNALQIVRIVHPKGPLADAFAALAAGHLNHRRPLVRAWAYEALSILASDNPALSRIGDVARHRAAEETAPVRLPAA